MKVKFAIKLLPGQWLGIIMIFASPQASGAFGGIAAVQEELGFNFLHAVVILELKCLE
jgi:hypothetical protein